MKKIMLFFFLLLSVVTVGFTDNLYYLGFSNETNIETSKRIIIEKFMNFDSFNKNSKIIESNDEYIDLYDDFIETKLSSYFMNRSSGRNEKEEYYNFYRTWSEKYDYYILGLEYRKKSGVVYITMEIIIMIVYPDYHYYIIGENRYY